VDACIIYKLENVKKNLTTSKRFFISSRSKTYTRTEFGLHRFGRVRTFSNCDRSYVLKKFEHQKKTQKQTFNSVTSDIKLYASSKISQYVSRHCSPSIIFSVAICPVEENQP